MDRALSAPGKLFLSGEYAVLWGGTARIAAVGPRAGAQVRRRADREVHLVLAEGRWVGNATPLGVAWPGPPLDSFHVVSRVVDLAFRAHAKEALGFELALAPGPRLDGRKLGVGNSARAAVLATEAARYVLEDRFDALKLALLSHAIAQGGGSGGDVAAVFAGGVIRYRRYELEALIDASSTGRLTAALAASPPVDLWRLPTPRVHLGYAFTGESASTPALIAEVERKHTEPERRRFVQRSDDAGGALEQGLITGDFAAVAEAVGALHELVSSLGPLETEPMQRVVGLARSCGCAAKLSGAGGGDGCILFAPDEGARAALLESLVERGFHAIPLVLETGLRGEPKGDPLLLGWLG